MILASKRVFLSARPCYGRVMIVWIALVICVVALVVLFGMQSQRSRENAEETARLRATGVTWDDWFER
jgi:uncharacterized membrane protein